MSAPSSSSVELAVGVPTEEWFPDFYRAHFTRVIAFLVRAGAEPAEAEDATQSAMEALLLHHESVRDIAAWIRVVARNNWLRSLRRNPIAVQPDAIESQVEVGDTDPAGILHQRMQQNAATELVRRLPPTQRQVVALIADGYNSDEIALFLGSTAAVVRSNLSHARRRLRRDIGRIAA
jgi:RNA polymerase sigma-70 factor (ECF subfamily)